MGTRPMDPLAWQNLHPVRISCDKLIRQHKYCIFNIYTCNFPLS